MSADSYQRYCAEHRDLVRRAAAARRRARRLGLRMVQRGNTVTLYDPTGPAVVSGQLDYIEAYLTDQVQPRKPRPAFAEPPPNWRPWVEMFVAEQERREAAPSHHADAGDGAQHVPLRPSRQ
jgi:hypothetical protein